MSPTNVFRCAACGHAFEVSRVVAQSSMTMTLCPQCGGQDVELVGESSRESPIEDRPAAASNEDAA